MRHNNPIETLFFIIKRGIKIETPFLYWMNLILLSQTHQIEILFKWIDEKKNSL